MNRIGLVFIVMLQNFLNAARVYSETRTRVSQSVTGIVTCRVADQQLIVRVVEYGVWNYAVQNIQEIMCNNFQDCH